MVAVATHVSSLNFLRTMASLERASLAACERSESRGGGASVGDVRNVSEMHIHAHVVG